MWGNRWMRIKPPFLYVRKSILGLTAIGIEKREEAVQVVVSCFFRFFSQVKKKKILEAMCICVSKCNNLYFTLKR